MTPAAGSSTEAARVASGVKLLMVEDERNVAETLAERLRGAGFQVIRADSVASARRAIAEQDFKLALLDVGLPDGNGFELARLLRERAPATAIVFLTAHASAEDRIHGLELGADDYVTKPFSCAELVSRVRALLRRRELDRAGGRGTSLEVGRLRVDYVHHVVEVDGRPVSLTPSEFNLLSLLAESPGQVFSRRQIMERLWRSPYVGDARACDVHISNLRRKLERDPSHPELILTVREFGYKLTAV